MESILEILRSLLRPGGTLIIIIVLLILNSWIFKKIKSGTSNHNIVKRSIAFLVVLMGSLVFIISLPIDRSLKGQILSFLGIIISAGIALSSTTVLGNLIAGFMNNSMNRFRNGDLIKLGDLQGRVTRRSAFHIEIQMEDSNFVTIPNLYIASNPVKLTRKSNTVISASVSLGYDVPRSKVEEALKEAALKTKLKDPYVYIMELGDYSVVYKIHGFLEDSNMFFSTSSQLNGNVMDVLHERGIEIVSPTFMNQRRVDESVFIPSKERKEQEKQPEKTPEELIFDEAIQAGEIEKKKDKILQLEKKKEEIKKTIKESKDKKEIENLKNSLERIENLKKRIEENIEEESNKSN